MKRTFSFPRSAYRARDRADYQSTGAGILIGLGLGFIATAFIKPGPVPDPATSHRSDNRWILVAVGMFMIVIGAGIIWSPANLWPYIIGIFLIVLGSIIAVKSLRNIT